MNRVESLKCQLFFENTPRNGFIIDLKYGTRRLVFHFKRSTSCFFTISGEKDTESYFRNNNQVQWETDFSRLIGEFSLTDSMIKQLKQIILAKKKKRILRLRLLNGLHGRAWETVEQLAADLAPLKAEDGEQALFALLGGLEKEGITQKTAAFNTFFKKSYRKRGTPMIEYLATKEKLWKDLRERDPATTLSEDLRAFFLLD